MGSVQHPVGQAVAAKAADAHKIDILHVRPVPKVADQPPEGGSRQYVVNRLFFCHFLASLVDLSSFRSEEHTSELQSLMRISYAVFCLKNKKIKLYQQLHNNSIVTWNKYDIQHE